MRGKRRVMVPVRWVLGAYAALILLSLAFCFWLI